MQHHHPVHLLHAEHAQHVLQGFRRQAGAQQGTGGIFHQQGAERRILADQADQLDHADLGSGQRLANFQGQHRQTGQLLLVIHQLRDYLAVNRVVGLCRLHHGLPPQMERSVTKAVGYCASLLADCRTSSQAMLASQA
ncbi:hypothetical protein D3C86_1472640 [compost metagenome]